MKQFCIVGKKDYMTCICDNSYDRYLEALEAVDQGIPGYMGWELAIIDTMTLWFYDNGGYSEYRTT